MNIKNTAKKWLTNCIWIAISPFTWMLATRPRRETLKLLIFNLPGSNRKWPKKWQAWKIARVWLDSKNKKQLYVLYPFIIRKKYEEYNPGLIATYKNFKNEEDKQYVRNIAILIHVYYIDVLDFMLDTILKNCINPIPIYITLPEGLESEVSKTLQNHKVAAYLHFVENRGRDIAPFISILPILKNHGISTVLKLHTKKSVHLHHSSSDWLSDILHKLVAEQKLEKHFNYLQMHAHVGMIVPYGHLLPLAFYYGENTTLMLQLAAKWNINSSLFGSAIFSAGSMFFARISALHQLMITDETEQNFESENGQLDGTLAHAIERMFCMLCTSNGYSIVDTENLETTCSYTVFTDHRQTR